MGCIPTSYVAGGPLLVSSTTRPTGNQLFTGLWIEELDTGRTLKYDGTGWVIMSEPTVTTFVPVLTASAGTITTPGARTFSYKRSDGWLNWSIDVAVTTAGTAAGAFLFTSLPIAPIATQLIIGHGREQAVTGNTWWGQWNGANMLVGYYNNTAVVQNGTRFAGTGAYQMVTRYS